MEPQLNPGDTVISLAGLTITTTIITGAINSAVVLWKLNHSWWLSLAAFFAVIVIWIIAKTLGTLFFTIRDTHVLIVKAGESALPSTLKAAFLGASIAMCVFGFAFAWILGGAQFLSSTWPIITLVSLVIGSVWGTLSALV